MLRVMLRRRMHDAASGCSIDNLFTLDVEVPELEQQLRKGGYGESGFEVIEMVGVEVLQEITEAK